MTTAPAFLRPTSISPARTSRGEHAPEGEGAVSGHTPVAPQDDDYDIEYALTTVGAVRIELENVPTRHRFKDRFRELTFRGNPSSGYQGLRATYRVGDFLRWIRAVLS